MDHIPLPNHARMPYPKVPCLCAQQDDVTRNLVVLPPEQLMEELDYRELTALQQAFLRAHARVATLDEAGPFLQSWLWFGTIEKIFSTVGVAVHLNDFITTEETCGLRLNTSLLYRYMWYWVAAEAAVSKDVQMQHDRVISMRLQTVWSVLRNYRAYNNPPGLQVGKEAQRSITDNSSNILLAIVLLAEVLDSARSRIYGSDTQSWFVPLGVVKWLLEAGWCAYEIEVRLLGRILCTSTLLYLTRINRSLHSKSHDRCTIGKCIPSKIDPATYRPAHVDENCLCSNVGLADFEKTEMESLLRKGRYPVITYSRTDASAHRMALHDPIIVDGAMRYVAISHVWSDRLGNLHENELPACQLNRIQNEVNSLHPFRSADIPFWIDTICVPREDTARRLAIQSMRAVYEQAEKVLVFDSTLRSIHSEASAEEVLLAIKLSSWSERLWTWHESVLARNIYFQLEDGVVDGDELFKFYHTKLLSHPSVVGLKFLLEDCDGPNRALCKDLVRVMTLSSDKTATNTNTISALGNKPHDSARDADMAYRYNSDIELGSAGLNIGSGEDKTISEPLSLSSAISMEHFEIASVSDQKNRSADVVNFQATPTRFGADHQAWTKQVSFSYLRLRWNGLFYPQKVSSSEPQPAIPASWLADITLSPSEILLCEKIRNVTRVVSTFRYWLRGFNLVFDEGGSTYQDLRAPIRDLRAMGLLESSRSKEAHKLDFRELAEVFTAISHRNTSWIEDEAICLGIILDLEPGKLYQTIPLKRMEVLVRMWNSVPRALLFIPGPRMGEQGLQWMPRSLLNSRERFSVRKDGERLPQPEAVQTENGLVLQGFAAFVSFIEMQGTDDFGLLLLHNEEVDCFAISKLADIQLRERGDLKDDSECVVIFETVPKDGFLTNATLVAVRRREKDVIFADYIEHTTVMALDARQKKIMLMKSRRAKFTSVQQEWCVG